MNMSKSHRQIAKNVKSSLLAIFVQFAIYSTTNIRRKATFTATAVESAESVGATTFFTVIIVGVV